MIIKVIPRIAMDNIVYDPDKVKNYHIISIYGQGMSKIEIDSNDFLQLNFDDITDKEYQQCFESIPGLRLFNKDHANKIIKYVEKLMVIKDKKMLLVNCHAGISRSGAVGKFANEIINEDNKDHYDKFYELNPSIGPNNYVYNLLNNTWIEKRYPNGGSAFGKRIF